MITILVAPDLLKTVQDIINKEYRLSELVQVTTTAPADLDVIKVSSHIEVSPDWHNSQPPVLLSITPLSDEALLGIVYAKLGNYERGYECLQKHPKLLQHIDLLNRLQNAVPLEEAMLQGTDAVSAHNKAIALHYDATSQHTDIVQAYETADNINSNEEQRLFTRYHLAQFYVDTYHHDKAEHLINEALSESQKESESRSKKHIIAFKDLLCKVWLKKIAVPYDNELLANLKAALWECLEYYEANKRTIEAAMILMDAANVAMISNSFSEALGYINKAVAAFDEEQLSEFSAQAHVTKGNLLQTWAQNGNPQFYRTAIQSYQEALRIFTKENAPDIFADVHHQLGKVYAEIPDEAKKKSVWAAISVSSFNEALSYYDKTNYPYQYAMICNDMGNAYTKYPRGVNTDNFQKALEWYHEALSIRTAEDYPIERVLTLSNYLEASWFVGNKNEFDEDRYNDMMSVANEILRLNADEDIVSSTKSTMLKLQQLKEEINM